MTTDKYILIGERPVIEPDLLTWGRWLQDNTRHVGLSIIGDSKVSTVFLGLDHNFEPDGPPILWETMVFGGALNDDMDRCSGSWEQAEAMHQKWVVAAIAAEFTWWRSFKRAFRNLTTKIKEWINYYAALQ